MKRNALETQTAAEYPFVFIDVAANKLELAELGIAIPCSPHRCDVLQDAVS